MILPFLSKPINIYKKTYLNALNEFQMEGLELAYDKSELNKDFDLFISKLIDLEEKPKTELGRVKESIYWLIDNEEFIGRISIRHTLTPYLKLYDGNIGFEIRPSKRKMGYGNLILYLGLKESKKKGLKEVIITCDDINTGSCKIIEKNGGKIVGKYPLKIEGKYKIIRKYLIEL